MDDYQHLRDSADAAAALADLDNLGIGFGEPAGPHHVTTVTTPPMGRFSYPRNSTVRCTCGWSTTTVFAGSAEDAGTEHKRTAGTVR